MLACLGALLGLCAPAAALDPDKAFHHYVRNRWALEQGLPQLTILAITQDRNGYLWFGTQAGLSRFDGVRFTTYDLNNTPALPSTWIQALHTDVEGRIWIGTSQGLAVHENGQFRAVEVSGDGDTTAAQDVVAIARMAGGELQVASAKGVYSIQDGRLHPRYPLAGPALSLLSTRSGDWIGGQGVIYRVSDGVPIAQALPADASAARVSRLLEIDGVIWAGSNQGLFRYQDQHWQRFDGDAQLARSPITTLATDSDANFWAATPSHLYRLREGRVLERIAADLALSSIRVIFEDREANLWLGSSIDGVARIWDGWTRRYSRVEGLENPLLWATAQGPDGRIWTAGDSGVNVLQDGRYRQAVAGSQLPHPNAYSVLPENGQTWIGTRAGAALYRNGRLQPLRALAPLLGAQVNGIVRDRQQRLWFATSQGLYRLDDKEHLIRYGEAEGLPDPRVRVLHETAGGRLLVGTQSGLYEWRDERLHALPMPEGIRSDMHITAIHELPGGQWVVGALSEEELFLFDGQRWHRVGRAHGIPTNAAFFMANDRHGFLWVGGLRGIYRVPTSDLLAVARGEVTSVRAEMLLNERGDRHGGQKGDCCNGAGNSRGFMRGSELWLPTRDGLVVMDSNRIIRNTHVPTSVIERVQVGQQWRDADPQADWLLPPQARDLRFEFTTLTFQAAEHVDIRYRLVGYDQSWRTIEDSHMRSATYTNLPAGSYSFEVIGSNNSGLASRDVARLPFRIAPYFYETLWFYGLLAALLATLLYLLYQWLQRRYSRQRAVLEQLVQQRTRDLQIANQRLEAISLTDPLTGLHNRRYLSQQIPADLAYYERDTEILLNDDVSVFALLDVDHFKTINDNHGHDTGDRVLQEFSELLRELVREGDYVARWGGEEFLLVFRPMPRSQLPALGQRICDTIAAHAFDIGNSGSVRITASVGLAEYPLFPQAPRLLGWEQMVSLADRALYQVKAHGRNGWAAYRPVDDATGSIEPGDLPRDPAALIALDVLQLVGSPMAPAQR